MEISFISTVYNEEANIDAFLSSLSKQTKLPDEIIITDAGSKDKTVERLKEFQKKSIVPVKIIIQHGNRSIGRNQAIKHASGQIIACSDAGCILDKNWLKNITNPFLTSLGEGKKEHDTLNVTSGYYLPKTSTIFEQCLATYTCVMSDKVDPTTFLPSSRSIAFKKSAWQQIGGYPEELDTCEDLIFATRLKKAGFKFFFTKKATVYWPQRKNIIQAFQQFFSYATGDGQAFFIRRQVPLLFLRYLIAIILLAYIIITKSIILSLIILAGLIFYIFWAINKNYKYIRNPKACFYLPLLQFSADIAVLLGTSNGILWSFWRRLRFTKASTPVHLIIVLSTIMLFMLLFRSGVFVLRIFKETKTAIQTRSLTSTFIPSIQPCTQLKLHLNAEEKQLLNYRSLGVPCKK